MAPETDPLKFHISSREVKEWLDRPSGLCAGTCIHRRDLRASASPHRLTLSIASGKHVDSEIELPWNISKRDRDVSSWRPRVSVFTETKEYHAIDRAPPNAMSPFVEVRGAEKVYRSARGPIRALADITLAIKPGEFVSLLGPSGCGKSTLLRCIAGLEPITGGSVVVAGRNVNGPTDDVGVVFQRDLLLDWRTVLDNVLIAAQFRGHRKADFAGRARSLLSLFGLQGYERRYPWELSGGMRQRVSICRALLPDPKFLLMDEPFGALDEMTRDDLNVELQDRWFSDQKTVLFVTHSISEAVFLSDRVLIMSSNPGRIVDEVTIDLPRKRPLTVRDSPPFVEYTGRIRAAVASIKREQSHG